MIPAHILIPLHIREVIPDIYGQEKVSDPIVFLKLFTPDAGAVWLITEYDGKDLMFGYCYLGPHMAEFAELGYISLEEVKNVRGRLGMPVERDLHFRPIPLSQALERESLPARRV